MASASETIFIAILRGLSDVSPLHSPLLPTLQKSVCWRQFHCHQSPHENQCLYDMFRLSPPGHPYTGWRGADWHIANLNTAPARELVVVGGNENGRGEDAIGAFGIVGPYFFENDNEETVTVNSELYVTTCTSEGFGEPQLRRLGNDPTALHFQQGWSSSSHRTKQYGCCSWNVRNSLSLVSATSLGLHGRPTLLCHIFSCGGSWKTVCSGGVSRLFKNSNKPLLTGCDYW